MIFRHSTNLSNIPARVRLAMTPREVGERLNRIRRLQYVISAGERNGPVGKKSSSVESATSHMDANREGLTCANCKA